MTSILLRQIPAIHELQKHSMLRACLNQHELSPEKATEWLQEAVAEVRTLILNNQWSNGQTIEDWIFQRLSERLSDHSVYSLRRIINGTGTVLHTNLGRAKLSEEAQKQVILAASSYSNLEYNVTTGKRGSRHDLIEDIVKEVTGAEAAMVVNNNAAAVYLVLKALATNKEVIVSRGELVEIGGSFRVSSIMAESGAELVEVGTTNKTHFRDYDDAINDETAMIMKVHTSNFKTIGFTSAVDAKELVNLAQENEIILYEDLGSGAIYDLRTHGIGEEPTVKEALDRGIDLVTFSGDKLLGGPQAGIIAGKKEYIDQLKKHQLARVLRVDKMTLAALEATLKQYVDQQVALKDIPTLQQILLTKDQIRAEAEAFKRLLSSDWTVGWVEDVSMVGGGTMPDVELPTWLLTLSHRSIKTTELIEVLRNGDPAVVTRIKDDQIALDFRTITKGEHTDLLRQLEHAKETYLHEK
ncbi:L-seryl-tRNA(Sec) selenium transferase [Bacillus sp. FJAT-45037]|uniref:L-seryl-tRNA(Sec) selenium transferase n=1 Tax=Bacillus sp. FJAT-45037 TaxID=2011007 RepID=UPI000C23C23E|nr:L-seryl-tRNA(Sec) selenium transferase [Bacillus sp. FJAT-45037]